MVDTPAFDQQYEPQRIAAQALDRAAGHLRQRGLAGFVFRSVVLVLHVGGFEQRQQRLVLRRSGELGRVPDIGAIRAATFPFSDQIAAV